jgi:hypothetical protein
VEGAVVDAAAAVEDGGNGSRAPAFAAVAIMTRPLQ